MSTAMTCALRFFRAVEGVEADAADLLHEAIEIHDFDLPDAGVYRGYEGLERWLSDWSAPWEEWSAHVHDLFDLGSQVVSLNHLVARTSSGITVDREDSQLCTIRDGKILKLEYFGDPVSALDRADDSERARARKATHDKIRSVYGAAVRHDVEGVVAQLSPQYEFYPETDSPMDDAYRGHDGARRYFAEMFEAWEIISVDVDRLVDAGDSVVALFQMRNRGRGSGIELDERWGEVWQTTRDQLVSSRFYTSHAEALSDAGLDPAPSTFG
jgi:ketosteroid isomerase-like protein